MSEQLSPGSVGGLVELIRAAGRAVMDVYSTDFSVRRKSDESPVTEADEQAEQIILQGLSRLLPGVPAISEEAGSSGIPAQAADLFWLVDPLDGTKEFIGRNGEFTVNLALICHGRPIFGLVLAPALDRLYGGGEGVPAFVEDVDGRRRIAVRSVPEEGLTVVSSRSHGDSAALEAFLDGRKVAHQVAAGSSLKLCLVAEGKADLYVRLGRTMEWDIAAGHAVLAAAGGSVLCVEGRTPLRYGKPGLDNPHFVAQGAA